MRGTLASFFAAAFITAITGSVLRLDGAEIRSGDQVTVKADETIADDLYAFGQQITIDGTVEGDVIAFGQQITINGTVKGHVMAAGQTVVVTGTADGARIAGQVLKLGPKAKLDGDILGAGFSLECAKDSVVGGDALYAGYQALFAGEIHDDLRGGMANCRLEGKIGGDVNVEVGGNKNGPPASAFGPPPPVPMPNVPGGLTIGESAAIDGDLNYTAPREAQIDPQAKLNGEVNHRQPAPKAKGAAAAPANNSTVAKIFGRVRHVACVLIVGVAALLLLPRSSERWVETIRTRPAASFVSGLIGLIAFIALLFIAVIAIIMVAVLLGVATLSELVPMVIVGGIVGYAALIVGFWIVVAFLAEALAGLALGRFAFRDNAFMARLGALVVGVLVLAVLLSIPYLGSLIGFVIMTFAIGSICLWLIGQAPPESFAPLPPGKPIPAALA